MKPQAAARSALRFRWEYLIVLALMALFTVKFLDKTRQIQSLNRQQAVLVADNHRLAADNVRIRSDIKYYRTDQYVRDAARGLLGYTLPGETTVEVQPVRQHVVSVRAAPPRPAAPQPPAWQQWLNAFGH